MKNGNINFTLAFIVFSLTLDCYYQLNSQMFASNSLGMKSMTSLEALKSQIEEKRKLLQMIYSQQIAPKEQSINNSSVLQKDTNNNSESIKSLVDNTASIKSSDFFKNEKNNSIKPDLEMSRENLNEKENQEIKPLLKSIVDMQYYTYQMLKKMKSSFDDLKNDVEVMKEKVLSENSSVKKESKNLRNNNTKIKLSKEEKLIDP